jgi:hypothetical protein
MVSAYRIKITQRLERRNTRDQRLSEVERQYEGTQQEKQMDADIFKAMKERRSFYRLQLMKYKELC